MAWATPVTVITGQTITAAWGNTFVRDNTRHLKGLDGPIDFQAGASFAGDVGATGDLVAGDDIHAFGSIAADADIAAVGLVTGATVGAVSGNVNASVNLTSGNDALIGRNVVATGNVSGVNVDASGDMTVGDDLTAGGDVTATGEVVHAGSEGTVRFRRIASSRVETHIRPNAGRDGYLTLTENGVADRWAIGIRDADPNLYLISGDAAGTVVGTLTPAGLLTLIGGGLRVAGVSIVNAAGKIPAIHPTYVADMNGSAITDLNASQLASGTIPAARFPATLPAASGANLTNLDAADLATGIIPDARIKNPLAGYDGGALYNLNADQLASGTVAIGRLPAAVVTTGEAVSQLTNDSGYLTAATLPATVVHTGEGVSQLTNDSGYLTAATLPASVVTTGEGVSQLTNDAGYLTALASLNADNLASGTVPEARLSLITPWAKVHRTSDQIMPQGTSTSVIFTARPQGNDLSMWNVANPTRIVAPRAGLYLVIASMYLRFPELMTTISLRANGNDASVFATHTVYNDTANVGVAASVPGLFYFTVAQYAEVQILVTAGGNANAIYLSDLSPVVYMARVGGF